MSNNRWRRILRLVGGKPILVATEQQTTSHGIVVTKTTFKLKIPEVSKKTSDEIVKQIQKQNLLQQMKYTPKGD